MLVFLVSLTSFAPFATQIATAQAPARSLCDDNGALCTETADTLNYEGHYTGHDEPSLLYYSNKAGSGNSSVYQLTLPKDPPTQPKQDGSGGTFNFQLHPAFWFGMAMCDTQSYPEFTNTCAADSDSNIFDNGNPITSVTIQAQPSWRCSSILRDGWPGRPATAAIQPSGARRSISTACRRA